MRQKLLFALLVASATIGTTQTLAQQNKFFASKPKTVKFNKLTYDRYEDKYDTAYCELKIGTQNDPFLIYTKALQTSDEKAYKKIQTNIDSLYIADSYLSAKPEIKIARKYGAYHKYLENQQYVDSIDNHRAMLKRKIEALYGEKLDLSEEERSYYGNRDKKTKLLFKMLLNKPEILQNNKGKLLYDYLYQYYRIASNQVPENSYTSYVYDTRKVLISFKNNSINYSREQTNSEWGQEEGKITLDNQNRIKQIKHVHYGYDGEGEGYPYTSTEHYTYTYDKLGNLQSINNVSKYKSEYDERESENITRYQYTNIENKADINITALAEWFFNDYYVPKGDLEKYYLMINTHSRYLPSELIREGKDKGKRSDVISRVTFDWEIDNNGMPRKVTVSPSNIGDTIIIEFLW